MEQKLTDTEKALELLKLLNLVVERHLTPEQLKAVKEDLLKLGIIKKEDDKSNIIR